MSKRIREIIKLSDCYSMSFKFKKRVLNKKDLESIDPNEFYEATIRPPVSEIIIIKKNEADKKSNKENKSY